jgi:K+-sensing histidine kinase KdpD
MDPDRMFERVLSCKAQLDRIRTMLSNFVDMNRIEDIPRNVSEEDIRELVDSVMEGFTGRMGIEHKNIRVECEAFRHAVDPSPFRQLLFNMVEHVLLVSGKDSDSTLRCREADGRLETIFEYGGAGDLSAEEREKIFDPAESVVDKETGVRYNKGFGLTYNRLMAARLGGSMRLEIDPDTGNHLLILDID